MLYIISTYRIHPDFRDCATFLVEMRKAFRVFYEMVERAVGATDRIFRSGSSLISLPSQAEKEACRFLGSVNR